MLPELNRPHGFLSKSETKGFIVTRASHKTVTSDACRDRKLPTIRQADSKASSKTGDFQVAPAELLGYVTGDHGMNQENLSLFFAYDP